MFCIYWKEGSHFKGFYLYKSIIEIIIIFRLIMFTF